MIIGTYEFSTYIKILILICFIVYIIIKSINTNRHKTRKYYVNNSQTKKYKRKKRKKRKNWKPLEHGDHTAEYIEAAWKEASK